MTEKDINKRSFMNGWMQLRGYERRKVREEMCKSLGINKTTWYHRLKGMRKTLDFEEKEIIELIFAKYGIVNNIWGDDLCVED